MDFRDAFQDWLERSIPGALPSEVTAFSFNLFEIAGTSSGKFGVELVGCGRFDMADSDWACSEVWEPYTRRLVIPAYFSGSSWTECQANLRGLILLALKRQTRAADCLNGAKGVALGFVDGELEIIRSDA